MIGRANSMTTREPAALGNKQRIALDRLARTVAALPPQRLPAFVDFVVKVAEQERADAVGEDIRDWPDTPAVVREWRIPERTLRRHIAEGKLKPVRIGSASRFYRFDPAELLMVYGRPPAEPTPATKHGAPPNRRRPGGG